MKILAIDPGAKPGYAVGVYAPGRSRILEISLTHPQGSYDLTVVEGQYVGKDKTRQSQMTLSFTAGWLIGQTVSKKYAVLKPAEWKPMLFRNGNSIRKEVFCRRVYRRLLTDLQRATIDAIHTTKSNRRDLDALDACGILLATFAWLETGEKFPKVLKRP